VGTGRIALPLAERGLDLVGTDIAAGMLARLVDNAGGRAPFPLLRADATAMPFADASFGGVLACHVLHLIPDSSRAVDEAWRVLRPGGCLLLDFGGGAPAWWWEETGRIFREHGINRTRPGDTGAAAVATHLGTQARELPGVQVAFERTLAQDLADWEGQIHSWTWPHPPAQMKAACAAIRSWAADIGHPLDEVARIDHVIRWWAFDKP
jgi:SAM-dependent methyltransferase